MAMAEVCGWDPSFLAHISIHAQNPDVEPAVREWTDGGATLTETRIETPYGELSSRTERKKTSRTTKHMLENENDYRKMTWLLNERLAYNEDSVVSQVRTLQDAIGNRGILGTWIGPPISFANRDQLPYHLYDWPEACEELRAAVLRLQKKQLRSYAKAGLDYIFYCVDGTEWISPSHFEHHIMDDTEALFEQWRSDGGFVMWHSCGKIRKFIENGYYSRLSPEIMETFSEPPVGDLPSLRWARERIPASVVTKGNMPLNILLEGTPDEIRGEVCRIKDQTRGYRHIVGLSDAVLPGTPLENCRIFVEESQRP
jgi:hypothetical protein